MVLEDLYMRKRVQTEDGKKAWLYNYEMFANTVDLVVFNHTLEYVMLVKRGPNTQPEEFRNTWAIPGGFLNRDETSSQGAAREYYEETGEQVKPDTLIFVGVADEPNRDPRQRTVGLLYTAVAEMKTKPLNPVDVEEIAGVQWAPVSDLLEDKIPMAFDHKKLFLRCLKKHDKKT